jgi:Ion channel
LAINFTTLGYGDIVMSRRWRLLGPLEAVNGSLMLGLSAAMLFAVLGRVVETRATWNGG